MSRPLRIEFAGAMHHVTARGNDRMPVVLDDGDRLAWLERLEEVVERYELVSYAYCLLDNHFHLLVETPRANLGRAMQRLCSLYALGLNRRRGRVGHLFQGRFGAVLVERGAHLLAVIRYVALNPVRAGLCDRPESWRWSSYPTVIGVAPTPGPVAVTDVLALFGDDPAVARRRLIDFVAEPTVQDPFRDLRGGRFLGSEEFARTMSPGRPTRDVARTEWQPVRPPLATLVPSVDADGLAVAHREFGYTLREIAEHLGVHRTTVGRHLARAEREMRQRSL